MFFIRAYSDSRAEPLSVALRLEKDASGLLDCDRCCWRRCTFLVRSCVAAHRVAKLQMYLWLGARQCFELIAHDKSHKSELEYVFQFRLFECEQRGLVS
jgi:hypothetical protein